ncbi:polysaccharide biosynthesis tyrosine autokinase [Demequina sp. SYSU T00039]|uniref:Polysaccharide biosynthesis tyrosine autokinase n=2 Tax=Demequina lignilytica TaxID=3051663 RepID=A0AAW7M1C8_9MICO|nr:polysaccharide biosynthesis tyrosine autokinase [Demequina sp. SYSU T00039]MDN4488224.1 polysaccharide biosynthesis tyrosine autokinase [Demequina sp. SYSU T00039]
MGLVDYARMLRAHWLTIVLLTLVGGALAYAWALSQPQVYTASGSAVLTAGVAEDLETAELGDRYAKSLVSSYLDVARSQKVGEYAADELGITVSAGALTSRVSVSSPSDSATLRFSATGPTPEAARDLVSAWIAGTAAVVADIETGGSSSAESVVRLEVLDEPGLPTSPSSPDIQRAVVLGILAGLVVGVGVAFVRGALDRRLRRREDVERDFDLPVLGTVPLVRQLSRSGSTFGGETPVMKEALRALRTNFQFIDIDRPPRVIVVTSSLMGDGKSTMAYMLADVLAALGKDVILVDADLRRPRLAQYLGLEGSLGLTDVLVGRVDPLDVLQDYGPTGHLSILTAGQVPPNPSELVASDAMKTLLYSFPEDTVVLVDTPPLIPVTDAAVLAARTDGALVVARAGRTTVDVLDRALASLDRVDGHPLGVILNGVTLKGIDKAAYAREYAEPEEMQSGGESWLSRMRARLAGIGEPAAEVVEEADLDEPGAAEGDDAAVAADGDDVAVATADGDDEAPLDGPVEAHDREDDDAPVGSTLADEVDIDDEIDAEDEWVADGDDAVSDALDDELLAEDGWDDDDRETDASRRSEQPAPANSEA